MSEKQPGPPTKPPIRRARRRNAAGRCMCEWCRVSTQCDRVPTLPGRHSAVTRPCTSQPARRTPRTDTRHDGRLPERAVRLLQRSASLYPDFLRAVLHSRQERRVGKRDVGRRPSDDLFRSVLAVALSVTISLP